MQIPNFVSYISNVYTKSSKTFCSILSYYNHFKPHINRLRLFEISATMTQNGFHKWMWNLKMILEIVAVYTLYFVLYSMVWVLCLFDTSYILELVLHFFQNFMVLFGFSQLQRSYIKTEERKCNCKLQLHAVMFRCDVQCGNSIRQMEFQWWWRSGVRCQQRRDVSVWKFSYLSPLKINSLECSTELLYGQSFIIRVIGVVEIGKSIYQWDGSIQLSWTESLKFIVNDQIFIALWAEKTRKQL